MNDKFQSYRALVADALVEQAIEEREPVIVRGLRFAPSNEARQRAKAVGERFHAGRLKKINGGKG